MSNMLGKDPRKHSIVQFIISRLKRGKKESYKLDDSAIVEIRDNLLSYSGQTLADATIAIGSVAQFLVEHAKSPSAAIRLANEVALKAAPGIEAFVASNGKWLEKTRQQGRKFQNFQQR
jgi:hypothetical protein